MDTEPELEDVRNFWNDNPLFTGESVHEPGSREFFEEHRKVVIDDYVGKLDERFFPKAASCKDILDIGCGPGMWAVELALKTRLKVHACDLTQQAIMLTRKRAKMYEVDVEPTIQNAEDLNYKNDSFDHINCIGVIHHTPDTQACILEIQRVLRPGGSALIGVYHKNFVLKNWNLLHPLGKLASLAGAKLRGRDRESIYAERDTEKLIRQYDGKGNPIGKAYSKEEFRTMLEPYFHIESIFLHFFPARTLPIPIPKAIHRYLDRKLGFMIYGLLTKR